MISHKRLIETALALKADSNCTERCFHVTYIFEKSKMLAVGMNNSKTHPRNLRLAHYDSVEKCHYGATVGCHSELRAILNLGKKDCSKFDFYNVRIDMNGKANMSAPCKGCKSLLSQVGYKSVYYTNKDGIFQKL